MEIIKDNNIIDLSIYEDDEKYRSFLMSHIIMFENIKNGFQEYIIKDVTNDYSFKKILNEVNILLNQEKLIYYVFIPFSKFTEIEKINIAKGNMFMIFHKDNNLYFSNNIKDDIIIEIVKNFLNNGIEESQICRICEMERKYQKMRICKECKEYTCNECMINTICIECNYKKSKAIDQKQYHHYIPQFILKNFNVNKNIKNIKIKVYDTIKKDLYLCKTNRIYGTYNMYRDINNESDVMFVEKELSKLESYCSNIIYKIINSENHKINLNNKEILRLKKFLLIIRYRSKNLKNLLKNNVIYTDNNNIEYLKKIVNKNNTEIWLNDLKEILITEDIMKIIRHSNRYKELIHYKDNFINNNISDMVAESCFNVFSTKLQIWEADDETEFILTDKHFGSLANIDDDYYQVFHVISPKILLVLVSKLFKPIKLINKKSLIYDDFKIISKIPIKNVESIFNENDNIFNYFKLNKYDVYKINSCAITEFTEHISYTSNIFMYKMLIYYNKTSNGRNLKEFKKIIFKKLFNELNRVHIS